MRGGLGKVCEENVPVFEFHNHGFVIQCNILITLSHKIVIQAYLYNIINPLQVPGI